MKKNADSHSIRTIRSLERDLDMQELKNTGDVDETLTGRLGRVVTVFGMIRPLLVALTVLPLLPKMTRSAVLVLVQSIDALAILAVPGDADDVADFKAGRDL